jgi:hypothetical protein
MHERIIIELQKFVFKNVPKTPALSSFTLLTRTGQAPLRDIGTMVESVTGSNPSKLADTPFTLNAAGNESGIIGSKHPGARLHNEGGVITPKRAKALALPATKEAKKAGGPRNFPRDLFFVPTRKDYTGPAVGWLAESKGSGKKRSIKRHYQLRESVVIPKRKWFPSIAEAEVIAVKVIQQTLKMLASGKSEGGKPSAQV